MAYAQHPLEAASDSLDIAAAVLTGDPAAGAATLEKLAEGRGQPEGETDGEPLRQAARELCINSILLSRELQRNASNLVVGKTAETAVLLRALNGAVSAAASAFVPGRSRP